MIRGGRHPLLKTDHVEPLDFHLGDDIRGMVITGPNTGGKTVALKTIGLLSLMAQCGLHVPAEEAAFTLNNYVLSDIGDGQSISENLSTFSSHITNIIEILKLADDQSLVLLDELGSGTDPAEGMGLGIAILEELLAKKCLFVATSHYPEVKAFADSAPSLVNARMAFDRQTLLPLYRLEIGQAGESCALHIATRLGLPPHLVQRAWKAAYGENTLQAAEAYKNESDKKSATTHDSRQRIQTEKPAKPAELPRSMRFNVGDSVLVYPQKEIGIVYCKANDRGEIGVQVKKKKMLINHKRIKLQIPASELYPDNYDFSIIFDSVASRKARHVLGKRHDPNIVIKIDKGQGGELQ